MRVIFRGRCNVWWAWRMSPVAPRTVLDVPYVTRINHEIHFSGQAQYLVKLDCHFSFFRGRFTAFFHTKCIDEMGQVSSPKRRVQDDDFMVGSGSEYRPIMLGLSSNCLYYSLSLLLFYAIILFPYY